MADSTDLMARGLEITGKLWGARAGGQELPAQKLAPVRSILYIVLASSSGSSRTLPPSSSSRFLAGDSSNCPKSLFGMFWSRPNLDLRSRSLCTVAQLAALGKTDELRAHLAGALNLGIRREELIEVLMQTACYAGVPAAVQALNAAAAVLAAKD